MNAPASEIRPRQTIVGRETTRSPAAGSQIARRRGTPSSTAEHPRRSVIASGKGCFAREEQDLDEVL